MKRKRRRRIRKKQTRAEEEKIEEGIRSCQKMAFERQNSIQRWDCSQIENEEEESWKEGDQ